MEELTKSQIVLLTLLTSFVTSIATGIVTVSLLDQAPQTITQSVSRVIQETVEKTPATTKSQNATAVQMQINALAAPVSSPNPSAPLSLADAVKKASSSLVRLYTTDKDAPIFLGFGVVIDAAGTIVADYDSFGDLQDAQVTFSDGTAASASVRVRNSHLGLVYLAAATSTSLKAPSYVPAVLQTNVPDIGNSIITLSGKSDLRIASGLVVAIMPLESDVSRNELIDTDINALAIGKGSPLIDAQGRVIGISTGSSRAVDGAAFIPASQIVMPAVAPQSAPKASP